jgi:hypothetical protein
MLSIIPHFGKITNTLFSAEFGKETLVFEKGEVIENSTTGTNGNDLDSPRLKQ